MPQDILERLKLPPFNPLFGFKGHLQTIGAYYFPYYPFINNSKQHVISLEDGDKIILVENQPLNWTSSQRIILLVHGLTGSHRSKYFVRATRFFVANGYKVIRMNLRGCGLGKGLAKQLYHSGRSEDTRAVLHWLKDFYPNSPVTQIGFSLGANITLKMAGEDGKNPSTNLDSLIAVSVPLDLEASVKRIIQPHNRFFNNFFVKELKNHAMQLHRHFPQLPEPKLDHIKDLYQFDDYYTAPRSGFKDAHDYYTQSSSGSFIDKITLPTLILHALDDPVVDHTPFLNFIPKDNIELLLTKYGGHVAWLGKTNKFSNFRWMDRVLLEWTNDFDRSVGYAL